MDAYIRIIVLCTIPSVLSCIIHEILNESKKQFYYIVKIFIFYISIFYTVLSLIKVLSNMGNLTLLDSFLTVSNKTYLHHAFPLLILSIAVPFVIKKIMAQKTNDFIFMYLSITMGLHAVIHLIWSGLNNLQSSCVMLTGLFLSLLVAYFYKGEVHYSTFHDIKERLSQFLPIMSFWIILMILYLPNELYFGNRDDLEIPYGNFIQALLLGSAGYLIIYSILTIFFLTKKQFSLVCEVIFAVTFASYLQSIVLNGKMAVMDGTMQTWTFTSKVINLLIWIAIISITIALKYIVKKNTNKIYSIICIYIALIQLVSWGYMGITAPKIESEEKFELTTEGRLTLHPQNNVLVFILDWYDGQLIDKLLAEDKNYLEPLSDFTYYENMTSLYAFTDMSIPYLLDHVEWQYDMEENVYINYADQNGTFLQDIDSYGYDIGIYTYKKYIGENIRDIVRNYSDTTSEGWRPAGIFNQMLKCSKYKTYPFILKNKYWYYTDSEFTGAMREVSEVFDPINDNQFYSELITDGIQIEKKGKGAFRFYHMRGPHPPHEPDIISMARNSMNMVYEYLEQLKSAGIYDNATIIITADHGQNYHDREQLYEEIGLNKSSSPILFVKEANQTNENGLKISMAPVSHKEMAATVMKAICGDTLGYGETFSDIAEDSEIERYWIFRRHDDIPYRKYVIRGNARDWDDWYLEP